MILSSLVVAFSTAAGDTANLVVVAFVWLLAAAVFWLLYRLDL